MIFLIIFKFLMFVYAATILGNLYAGVKIWALKHRWGRFIAPVFFASAINSSMNLITLGFGPAPVRFVLWPVILLLIGRSVMAIAITILVLFLFGWINGINLHGEK